MAPDDQGNLNEAQRKALLEEIRRRAEEAETKRINEEERQLGRPAVTPSKPADAPVPFPPPAPSTAQPASDPAMEQRVGILRERLTIALERGKIDRATSILAELKSIVPAVSGLEQFEKKLEDLRTAKPELPSPPAAPPPAAEVPEVKPQQTVRPAPTQKGLREPLRAPKKSPAELLEDASGFYQQEKYDKAAALVTEVLGSEPDNEDALRLQEQIEKAKQIIELVRKEEAKRKAEEAVLFPNVRKEQPVPISHEAGDVWGPQEGARKDEDGLEIAPEEKGPVGPPKRRIAKEVLERVSGIQIPWKQIGAVLLVIAAGIAGYVIVDHFRTAVAPPEGAIVVLPPVVPAADSSIAAVADGLAEDLMADLSTVNELRVVGAQSAFSYRGSPAPPTRIARSVGASHYLLWSIGRLNDQIVIAPSLFDTISTSPVWVSRYEVSARELPATRMEMARKVVAAMGLSPNPEKAGLLGRIPTSEPAAYDAYSRGRVVLRSDGEDSLAAVIAYFSAAVGADSAFPDAQSSLGWAYLLSYELADQPGSQTLTQALACVQRALQLGWRGSEPFRTWGMVTLYQGDRAKATERLEGAVQISPSDAESHRRLAVLQISVGRFQDAIAAAQEAQAMDPANLESYRVLGNVQQFLGQYVHTGVDATEESKAYLTAALGTYERGARFADERSSYASSLYADLLVFLQMPTRAQAILVDRVARLRDSYSDFYRLARIKQAAGAPKEEWQADLRRAKNHVDMRLKVAPGDAVAYSYLALIQTRLGEFKGALAASKQARLLGANKVSVLYSTARMFTLQRDRTQALEFLGRAVRVRYSLSDILDMDFYNLRTEPAFLATVAR